MHVIQWLDADGKVLEQYISEDRESAFGMFDAASGGFSFDGSSAAEIVMWTDGKIHRRHRVTRREQRHADDREAPAADDAVRERTAGDEAAAGRDAAEADRPAGGRAAKATDPVSKRKRPN